MQTIPVPPVGPVIISTTRDRLTLWTVELRDISLNRGGAWRGVSAAVEAATREGQVLCARPYDGYPEGRFGLTKAEADDLAHWDERLIVAVDPYTTDGESIVADGVDLTRFSAYALGKAAA